MKATIRWFIALLICLSTRLPLNAQAAFNVLHAFSPLITSTLVLSNSDGANPMGLILSGKTLYGTSSGGGSHGFGTLFAVNTDGTGFTVLHNFNPYTDSGQPSSLLISGNAIYGTASFGPSSDLHSGIIFTINSDGTGFKILYTFSLGSHSAPLNLLTNSDGIGPQSLIFSNNILYGAAAGGGLFGNGTLFSLNADGTGFRKLYDFSTNVVYLPGGGYTNSDGAGPYGLILCGNTLYGSAADGGPSGLGTIFSMNTDGTDFQVLNSSIEANRGVRYSGLILSGNNFYGTTINDQNIGYGAVFSLKTNGAGFAILHTFNGTDGCFPNAIVLSGNTLFGTTLHGGSATQGTVFSVNTDGSGYTPLYSFTALPPGIFAKNSDGAEPFGLILSGKTLYGIATQGGASGNGTVFSLNSGQ